MKTIKITLLGLLFGFGALHAQDKRVETVAQYPDSPHLIFGILFFAAKASILGLRYGFSGHRDGHFVG